jgi:hypothetical protein
MKTKFPIFVLPMLVMAIMFYAFSTENTEVYKVNTNSSVSGTSTLVLVHDSSVTTTKRKADRDTLIKYLPAAVGSYDLITFDTNTVLPDLSSYDQIILQETSFDVSLRRWLGATARGQIKAWLASGTSLVRKTMVSIGADQGYNYSRVGSNGRDLEFAEIYCRFIYRVDNKPGSTSPSTNGTNVDIGNSRPMSSTVPGGGYWPDGCSMYGGGVSLYKYQNNSDAGLDTLAAIGNIKPGYVVATMFQDPRYFTSGFGDVLSALVNWVNDNDPLPVELSSFVSSVNGNNVTLNWSTANELNNSGFDIERSSVANEWTKVGSVEGNGTTNETSSYSYTDRALATGLYSYRLKQIDFNGNFEYFNLSSEVNVGVPLSFDLSQNYPNPFNPSTTIEFALPVDGFASITVFDMSGKQVSSLVNEFKTSGYHTVRFDGSSLSSGNYFYKLQVTGSKNFTETKKMVLVK